MAFGHSECGHCKAHPTHELRPCRDKICQRCYYGAEEDCTTCGTCGKSVLEVLELLHKTPTILAFHPADATWSFARSSESTEGSASSVNADTPVSAGMDQFDGAGSNGDASDRTNSSANSNANGNGNKKNGAPNGNHNNANGKASVSHRDDPATPTPGAQNVNAHPRPRYVPPMLRANGSSPEIRPQSSISNASFASQAPMPSAQSTPYSHASQGFSTPRGYYTYGPSELTQHMASYDPFVDARPAPPMYGNDHHRAMNMYNRYVARSTIPPRTSINVPPTNAVSTVPSPSDSAVANPKGVMLANMIRAGMADCSDDSDYGNPGASRRAPLEPPMTMSMVLPQPRGRVADVQSTDSSPHHGSTKGNVAAFLGVSDTMPPAWLHQALQGVMPTIETLYKDLPMIEACRAAMPSAAGVIKVGGFPYASSRAEIVAVLGRHAQILSQPEGSPYHAVHIVMERQSGKTLDAYVEFVSVKEAQTVANQFTRRLKEGRQAKVGDRTVTVELMTQAQFMAELFPHGKNVTWHGGVPKVDNNVDEFYPGVKSSGFQGFLQMEEITHMIKHAETPQRSPFAQRCLIRTYEHLTTVLHKYPWHAVENVLLIERHALFDCTFKSIRALIDVLPKLNNDKHLDKSKPTSSTLQELAVAALVCPGFSEGQKAAIVRLMEYGGYGAMTKGRGMNFRLGGTDKFASSWPFHVLVKQPGVSDQVVEYVAQIMREATSSNSSLAELHAMRASPHKQPFFGKVYVDYGAVNNLADTALAELSAIEEVLRHILPSTRIPRS